PLELLNQIQTDEPADEDVKKYIELKLSNIFPSAESMTKAMSVDCVIKAVTYETILDQEFQDQIRAAYPLINWNKMFEEYSAAPES
ncbi:MAG TPA: hypothetical protein VJ280_02260, partial [Dehalococcoidales bacterium]|nr:hypothetical protein [Dehalococcoidales bacterium]